VVLEDSGSKLRRALIFYLLSTAKTLLPTVYMMEPKSKHVTYIPPICPSFLFVTLTCGRKTFLSDLLRNKNSASSDLNTHISPEQLVSREENAFCGDVIVVDLRDDVETPQRLTCKVFM
jgi:hypothetical protein